SEPRSLPVIPRSTRVSSARSSALSATSGTNQLPKRRSRATTCRRQVPFPRQTVIVATKLMDSSTMVPALRKEIAEFEPQLAFEVDTASHFVASTLARQQLGMTLMLIFGATALVLAAVGIYGVIAYAATQRLGEIATRLALGATPSQVFRLMMFRGQGLGAAG